MRKPVRWTILPRQLRCERSMRPYSTAADRDHDFEPVAFGQCLLRKLAARHDFTIALDGDAFVRKLHLPNQLGDAEGLFERLG